MTIDEAIEILDDCTKGALLGISEYTRCAFKLGVESLKFRLLWEQQEGESDFPLLPGETEE